MSWTHTPSSLTASAASSPVSRTRLCRPGSSSANVGLRSDRALCNQILGLPDCNPRGKRYEVRAAFDTHVRAGTTLTIEFTMPTLRPSQGTHMGMAAKLGRTSQADWRNDHGPIFEDRAMRIMKVAVSVEPG